jgi:hypothetical protein
MVLTTRMPNPNHQMAREWKQMAVDECLYIFGASLHYAYWWTKESLSTWQQSTNILKSYLHNWEIHVQINYAPQTTWQLKQDIRYVLLKYCMYCVRFEVFTAVTMKNGVFWDVTLCRSCMNRRFGGT